MERTFNLRVSSPDGKRISVTTATFNGKVKVTVPYIKAVADDGDMKEFSKKGVISFTVNQAKYQRAKEALVKYLEDLFIKELGKNGHSNTNARGRSDSSGVGQEPGAGSNEKPTGKDGDTVRGSGGGRKSSKGTGTGTQKASVAKGDDTPS